MMQVIKRSGRREEVSEYADRRWQSVLEDLPGLTDLATFVYRNEEEILAGDADPALFHVVPAQR